MRRLTVLGLIGLVLTFFNLAVSGPHKYVGSAKCKTCHMTPKSGEAYPIWQKTKHAKAYETLASDESKKIASSMGISDPQKSDKCLSCHITGHGVPDSLKEATLTNAEGVGCEACHGPGSDYKAMTVMKDRQKAIAAGLLIPNEKTCLSCHNEKSPTYKPFKYQEMLKKIAHPIPKAAAEEKKG